MSKIPQVAHARNLQPDFPRSLISTRGHKVAEIVCRSLPEDIRNLPAYAEMPDPTPMIYRRRSFKMRKFGGSYGLDDALFAESEEYGALVFCCVTEDKTTMLYAPLERFARLGKLADFGYGMQRFLSIKEWDAVDRDGCVVRVDLTLHLKQASLFMEVQAWQ